MSATRGSRYLESTSPKNKASRNLATEDVDIKPEFVICTSFFYLSLAVSCQDVFMGCETQINHRKNKNNVKESTLKSKLSMCPYLVSEKAGLDSKI